MFITLEGIEGCGKSTQAGLLKKHLARKGKEVVLTMEPGGSRLGIELRRILLSMESGDLAEEAELFLYLADRAQHVKSLIRPALTAGKAVISDRFSDSTVVYQGYGRGMDPGVLDSLNKMAVKGLAPDLTILLDLPAEKGLERARARNVEADIAAAEGRFEAEGIDFHQRIRQGYLTWAAKNQDRFFIVDASLDADDIFAVIVRKVDEFFQMF